MKLRIKGQSIRLRVSRSELARILDKGSVEETIQFTPAPESKFTYALGSADQATPIKVQYEPQSLTITLSRDQVLGWGAENEVGIYSTLDLGVAGALEVVIEKDFACLDRSDEENEDTFANPHAGAVC